MNNFSFNEVIEMAVQIEKSGYGFYNRALERKDLDDKSRKLITRLRDEEIVHEKTFKGLRETLDIESILDTSDWGMVGSYLKAIADSHIFSKEDASIKLAAEAKDFKDIIKNAISFEKDTLLYFHSLDRFVKDEKSSAAVKRIIEEEASHVMMLKKFLEEA